MEVLKVLENINNENDNNNSIDNRDNNDSDEENDKISYNKEIRYLGCYFSSSNSRKRSIKRIKNIIEKFLNPIRRKHITVGHIAYLINHVLILRVVYVAQLMTLSENEWNLLFTPVIKLVKQICGLPRSYPTSALYHQYILGINNPWDQICANQITFFTYLINSNLLASRSIMIRCRAAQLRLAIHDNIFEYELESLFLGHQEAKSNLSLHNIIIAQKLNIVIQQDYINRTTWAISGRSIPIREIFITHRCLNLLRKIGISNSYPLIYASQLILPSGHTISWVCYRFIAELSAKGRAITHIDWYYIVDSVNRVENITTNIDIQQMEKTSTIELNEDNLGP
ncbi:hypothetical protein C1646_770751 [Rhizophagus diaphanus]|nr:hypothetical protein C1646_770751 [Rhizophagus diaphanus] [Rhizophagus sp. MUCL 43196]